MGCEERCAGSDDLCLLLSAVEQDAQCSGEVRDPGDSARLNLALGPLAYMCESRSLGPILLCMLRQRDAWQYGTATSSLTTISIMPLLLPS